MNALSLRTLSRLLSLLHGKLAELTPDDIVGDHVRKGTSLEMIVGEAVLLLEFRGLWHAKLWHFVAL